MVTVECQNKSCKLPSNFMMRLQNLDYNQLFYTQFDSREMSLIYWKMLQMKILISNYREFDCFYYPFSDP